MEDKERLKAGDHERAMFRARVSLQRAITAPFWLSVLLDMDVSEQVGGHTAVPDMFDDISEAVEAHSWKRNKN